MDETEPEEQAGEAGAPGVRLGPLVLDGPDWSNEELAFMRATKGLLEGLSVPVGASHESLRETMRMAGDLGLPFLHLPTGAGGPGHGVGASLLATQAAGRDPTFSLALRAVMDIIDALLLLTELPSRVPARAIGLCERFAVAPTLRPASFEAVTAVSTEGDSLVLDGALDRVPLADSADAVLVPTRGPRERALFLVDLASAGVEVTSGAPLPNQMTRVRLDRVAVPAGEAIDVTVEGAAALALCGALRGAFRSLGASGAILAEVTNIIRSGAIDERLATGTDRGRLAAALARNDLARCLCHHVAGAARGAVSAQGSADDGPEFRAALLREEAVIELAGMSSWYALAAAVDVAALFVPYSAEGRGEALDSMGSAQRDALEQGRAEARDAAEWTSSVLPRELRLRRLPAETEMTFNESTLAAAAHQSASMAFAAVRLGGRRCAEELAAELTELALMAAALDIEASLAGGAELTDDPARFASLVGASPAAVRSRAAGERVLEAVLSGAEREEALGLMRLLWTEGPFTPNLAKEPIERIIASREGLDD